MFGASLSARPSHARPRSRAVSAIAAISLSLVTGAALSGAPAPARAQQVSWNCERLARVDSLPGATASCWGYTDPSTGDEYAIIGKEFGTGFYNVSDPRNPVFVKFIAGPSSIWREMKTYRQWCYIVSEGGGPGAGLQIVSLTDPENPVLVTTYTGTFTTAHTVSIDSASARLYANGASGGVRILSLANPTAPSYLGAYSTPYVHDSFVRNDTCFAACIGVGRLIALDVSNPAAIDTLKRWAWPGAAPHNAWPTEDAQYLFTTDETGGGRVRSWSISPITSPIEVDNFTADPAHIVHNVHVRGSLAYVAHYLEGVQIVDVTDPTDLRRVGFYDTYTGGGGFDGAWGVFNYFPSGTIVVSDIENGLVLVDHWESAGAVAGVVTSAATSLPIAGAEVVHVETGRVFTADAAGAYSVDADSGAATLRFRAFGYDSTTVGVVVAAGDTIPQDAALTPLPGGGVAGDVGLAAGGAPVANAVVAANGTPRADTTDALGAFFLALMPAGSYTVEVDEYLFMPESLTAAVPVGANDSLRFLLEPVAIAYNFEDTSAAGWAVNVDGSDEVISGAQGQWFRQNPAGAYGGDGVPVQPENDHTRNPLTLCWATGSPSAGGRPPHLDDVDVGKTTLYSPVMNLTAIAQPTVSYWRWFSNDAGENPGEDAWRAQISSNGGTTWVTVDSTKTTANSWMEVRFAVAAYVTPTATVRMRFIAEDRLGDSIVKAALDDFRVWGASAVVGVESGPDRVGEAGAAGASALAFGLAPCAPNPARAGAGAGTTIRFDLPAAGDARLEAFSVEGRRVAAIAAGWRAAGAHRVAWDGRDASGRALPSGVYLVRLTAGAREATRKVVLLD